MSRRASITTVLAPALYLGLASCATNPVTGDQDFVLVTEAQELKIGYQVDQQVKQRYALYDAHGMQAYVETIGQRLAKSSHRTDLSYRFTLLDTAEVNAFALPGGYVYISRGILPYLNSEAELAGVPDEVTAALEAQIPHPSRLGRPSEYASLVAHIVDNGMLNGEVIRLDGALRMPPR